MSEAFDDDGRSTTRVVFDLSITSSSAIPELEELRTPTPRTGAGFHYGFGAVSRVEDLLADRAHTLGATVTAVLDRLDETGIDPDSLGAGDRTVRARFSVSPGSETLPADVVGRLARIHADILMDSWG